MRRLATELPRGADGSGVSGGRETSEEDVDRVIPFDEAAARFCPQQGIVILLGRNQSEIVGPDNRSSAFSRIEAPPDIASHTAIHEGIVRASEKANGAAIHTVRQ